MPTDHGGRVGVRSAQSDLPQSRAGRLQLADRANNNSLCSLHQLSRYRPSKKSVARRISPWSPSFCTGGRTPTSRSLCADGGSATGSAATCTARCLAPAGNHSPISSWWLSGLPVLPNANMRTQQGNQGYHSSTYPGDALSRVSLSPPRHPCFWKPGSGHARLAPLRGIVLQVLSPPGLACLLRHLAVPARRLSAQRLGRRPQWRRSSICLVSCNRTPFKLCKSQDKTASATRGPNRWHRRSARAIARCAWAPGARID